MSRFSVVIPAYNIESYIECCITSVTDQDFDDFEVIVVDDGSTDSTASIITACASLHPRIKQISLPLNGGLGNARNLGIEASSGEYIVFLDGDDVLKEGALRRFTKRLNEAQNPDVLLYDFEISYHSSHPRFSGGVERKGIPVGAPFPEPSTFTLRDFPAVASMMHVAWNKAYRRDFISDWDFQFTSGYYEDLPWTYQVLLAAESLSILNEVGVTYLWKRPGGITASTGPKHMDIFAQLDHVSAFMAKNPETSWWRDDFLAHSARWLFSIARSPEVIPGDALPEFKRLCSLHFSSRPEYFSLLDKSLDGDRVVELPEFSAEVLRLSSQIRRSGGS